jgi:hypothetical protein
MQSLGRLGFQFLIFCIKFLTVLALVQTNKKKRKPAVRNGEMGDRSAEEGRVLDLHIRK